MVQPRSRRLDLPTNDNNTSKLEALLDSAVDAIITIDKNARIQSVNKSAERLFGYSEQDFLDRNVKFLMPEPWASEHDGYIHSYQKTNQKKIIGIGREVEGKRKDGSVFPMHLSVSEFEVDGEVFYTGIIHDTSAQKTAEASLLHAQKMEAIGQLSGGIAHDFNNLLTVITGNLELLEMQLDDPDKLELLREAQKAADLGAELTNRLLAVARRSILEPTVVDLNELMKNIMPLLARSLGNAHTLKINIASDLWRTKVDTGQVESAILNLAVNARDALEGKGKLILEACNFVIDAKFEASELRLAPGEYIRLSVSDTGTGMSPEVTEKAFDPFFTTKKDAHGTGLGLSMVHGFCKQSGGTATIYSEVGFGTTVNLYLPRHISDVAETPTSRGQMDKLQQGQGQLILAVEDDIRVRRLTIQRLEALGYTVIAAENGADAQELLATTPNIELVFTDLVMPGGMSGFELTEFIQKTYPTIKVLITSGYTEELVCGANLAHQNTRILRKPYRQSELASLLNETLQTDVD